MAWLVDTNVSGVLMTSSPARHPNRSLSRRTARWSAAVAELTKCACGSRVYCFQASSNSIVLKPRPVHPFSRHSRISSRHSSTRNTGTKRWSGLPAMRSIRERRLVDRSPFRVQAHDLGRRAVRDDAPLAEQDGPLAEARQHVEAVRREHDEARALHRIVHAFAGQLDELDVSCG